jgi:hypothetical protein
VKELAVALIGALVVGGTLVGLRKPRPWAIGVAATFFGAFLLGAMVRASQAPVAPVTAAAPVPHPPPVVGTKLFRGTISGVTLAGAVKHGAQTTGEGTIENRSPVTWNARGDGSVSIGYAWTDEHGALKLEGRALLPMDVSPGKKLRVPLVLETPKDPGTYTLLLDLLVEQVAWFRDYHNDPSRLTVVVQ